MGRKLLICVRPFWCVGRQVDTPSNHCLGIWHLCWQLCRIIWIFGMCHLWFCLTTSAANPSFPTDFLLRIDFVSLVIPSGVIGWPLRIQRKIHNRFRSIAEVESWLLFGWCVGGFHFALLQVSLSIVRYQLLGSEVTHVCYSVHFAYVDAWFEIFT